MEVPNRIVSPQDLLALLPDLPRTIDDYLGKVPVGRLTTYGNLAKALGDVRASRWVGQYLLEEHPHGPNCPCHRVIRADGSLGHYCTGSSVEKRDRLHTEGIFLEDASKRLADYLFPLPPGPQPLQDLQAFQAEIAGRVDTSLCTHEMRSVGAVDVAYPGNSARAVLVEWDESSQRPKRRLVLEQPIPFPYISTYLAFRELPILLSLLEAAKQHHPLPDVLLVDGAGLAHPRSAGIACLLGVLANVRTIGVAKTHLCGCADLTNLQQGEWRSLQFEGREVGAVFGGGQTPQSRSATRRPKNSSTRSVSQPLYISPGHKISIEQIRDVILRVTHRRRLPEPIYWADRWTRTPDSPPCTDWSQRSEMQ